MPILDSHTVTHGDSRLSSTLGLGIRKDALPEKTWSLIRPIREGFRIKDSGNRNVRIAGKITLNVMLGHRVETISSYVVERLTTHVILGCDFCDRQVDAIKRRQRLVEVDDGTTVPMLRTSVRKANAVPLQPEQEFVPKKRR